MTTNATFMVAQVQADAATGTDIQRSRRPCAALATDSERTHVQYPEARHSTHGAASQGKVLIPEACITRLAEP